MSEDSYTEVSSQSWFGRIGNALKGIIVGLILIAVAFVLLFWNEGRAVKRHKTLQEGSGVVVSVSSEAVDQANQGKLVHMSGRAQTDETLQDPVFGINAQAIRLHRKVEMYQWRESSESEERKKLGGGTETVTTYNYNKTWSESPINSGDFRKPEGHQNPSGMPYRSEDFQANTVTVGGFTLSAQQVGMIQSFTPLPPDADYRMPERLGADAKVSGNGIYIGNTPSNPQIGDLRISFAQVLPTEISLVAQQAGSSFIPYQAKAGGTILLLVTGLHGASEMFAEAERQNTMLTWILRLVGFILMLFGFKMVLAPLAVFADVVPMFGNIVEAGTGLIAGLIAGILSFLTIGIAWLFYRPILAVVLFAAAGGLGYLIVSKLRKAKAAPQQQPMQAEGPPPPPPPPGA
jgi:uncharacterized membrane protein